MIVSILYCDKHGRDGRFVVNDLKFTCYSDVLFKGAQRVDLQLHLKHIAEILEIFFKSLSYNSKFGVF